MTGPNLVDAAGVEPAVPVGRRIYSPLGLPIFLHIHVLIVTLSRYACQLIRS